MPMPRPIDSTLHGATDYSVGTLQSCEPIQSGIENTNYFVTTTAGRYVNNHVANALVFEQLVKVSDRGLQTVLQLRARRPL